MTAEPMVLTGVVTDATGRAVAGARVALAAAPVPVPDIAAITDDDGRFAFSAPAPGSYRVEAFGDGGHGAATVELAPGQPASVRIVLQS